MRVKRKCAKNKKYLSCCRRPHFQCVVVRPADYTVATELQTGDDMVVVPFKHFEGPNVFTPPVHFYGMVSHICSLERYYMANNNFSPFLQNFPSKGQIRSQYEGIQKTDQLPKSVDFGSILFKAAHYEGVPKNN